MLTTNKGVTEELREEVNKTWDGSSPITWEMVEALEHGKCGTFISEQQRLVPGVSALYRMVTEDTEIGGYRIPKGWKIMTCPAAEQTALAGNKQTIDLSIDHSKLKESEYMPFGGGARKCIGYRFAREELVVWLMMLLKRYWIELDPNESQRHLKFYQTKIRLHRLN